MLGGHAAASVCGSDWSAAITACIDWKRSTGFFTTIR
jgi:hypothetical protein